MQGIYGLILGDGHVDKGGSLSFAHSIEQKDYAIYKQNLLINLGFKCTSYITKGKTFVSTINGKTYTNKDSIKVYTSRTTVGKNLRKLFYPDNYKIVPDITLSAFDWAILYMDDGNQNKISHYNTKINDEVVRVETEPRLHKYRINTQSFTETDNHKLQKSLRDYNIYSSLESKKGGYGKILVIRQKESCQLFNELIDSYIIDSMRYKIELSR
jgi:hypothetical protein